jgi:hypothetical protein
MRLRKVIFLSFFLSCILNLANAQNTLVPQESVRLIYEKEWSGGISLSSRGWGIGVRHSRITSDFRKLMFEAEFVKIKHPKEVKVGNPYYDNAKSYVYGKKNMFNSLRLGIGTQFLIFDRAPANGVEIRLTTMIGVSQGILKPVYLDIIKESNNQNAVEVVSEKYNEYEHFPDYNIYGYSGFSSGLGELSFLTGGYFKTGLSFDWASKDNKILALETGTVIDVFPKRVPIMANLPGVVNKWEFISFYASLSWGKKS